MSRKNTEYMSIWILKSYLKLNLGRTLKSYCNFPCCYEPEIVFWSRSLYNKKDFANKLKKGLYVTKN